VYAFRRERKVNLRPSFLPPSLKQVLWPGFGRPASRPCALTARLFDAGALAGLRSAGLAPVRAYRAPAESSNTSGQNGRWTVITSSRMRIAAGDAVPKSVRGALSPRRIARQAAAEAEIASSV
jgi:hypothetical protein